MTTSLLCAKRTAASVLMFGALAGVTMVIAAPAQAAEWSPVGGVVSERPDVGIADEAEGDAGTPAVAPDRILVRSTPTPAPTWPHAPPSSAATVQGWIAVTATAGGARIRSRPVDGPVLGTIGYGAGSWVSCMHGASDGHARGWSYRGGTYGWVRSDLWEVEQHIGPGGGGTPQVPRCP